MASTKKTSDGGHIIDVKRPGNSAPSSTSKPVIVTNRPILKDPMVVNQDTDDAKPAESLVRKTAPELKPLDLPVPDALKEDSKAAEPEKTSTKTSEVETPAAEKPAETTEEVPEVPQAPAENTVEAEPEPEKPSEDKPEEESPPAEPVPAPIEPTPHQAAPGEPDPNEAEDKEPDGKDEGTANPDAVAQAEAEKQAAHQQEVQKLVDAKQYFLPINSVEKRKSRRFVFAGILLSLILAAAWTEIALDAGLVTIPGVKPVTHFFSN